MISTLRNGIRKKGKGNHNFTQKRRNMMHSSIVAHTRAHVKPKSFCSAQELLGQKENARQSRNTHRHPWIGCEVNEWINKWCGVVVDRCRQRRWRRRHRQRRRAHLFIWKVFQMAKINHFATWYPFDLWHLCIVSIPSQYIDVLLWLLCMRADDCMGCAHIVICWINDSMGKTRQRNREKFCAMSWKFKCVPWCLI